MTYTVCPFQVEDAQPLCDLLNFTIRKGGSTAYEEDFDVHRFLQEFQTDTDVLGTFVASKDQVLCGFQTLYLREPKVLAIATFADQRQRYPGVGPALFAQTEQRARDHGAKRIVAKIRADNHLGLKYYRGRGFYDVDVVLNVPLRDGTPVDRIVTWFDL